jgi:2-isopropylmalate synthase
MKQIRIFDTTLRDGEQAPGFAMDPEAKLRMARALAELRVDVIEAGFAASSARDFQSIKEIASAIDGPTICSLARAKRDDILAAAGALEPAQRRRIHVFIGTSPLHREAKLHMDRARVLEAIRSSIALARDHFDDVEFSAEDAIRTERDFLVEALSLAAAEGARTLNVPDTVGYTTPGEIEDLFAFLADRVERPDDVIFSTHCHDDLGMAVANSLAAVRGGALQVECTVNGIGERAGNCALEDVVMALRTRADVYGGATGIDTRKIIAASRTLARITNAPPPRNKSIVGANAFAHESGIHQHGILQNRETYEIIKPEDVGLSSDGIVLGKHSGRHALAARAKALGHDLEGDRLERAFEAFKALADETGIVDTAPLLALLCETAADGPTERWTLSRIDIRSPLAANGWPVTRVELQHGSRGRLTDIAQAPGALDAAFAAISQMMGIPARVDSLEMQYLAADPEEEEAEDGQGARVLVEMTIASEGETFAGRARARDILPCCVSAFINAASNAKAVRDLRAGHPGKSQAA